MVLSDVQGTKIHASVKKDLISRFENKVVTGQWRTVENFGLSIATRQFKPTAHRYKMSFITQTIVNRMDSVSDDPYLTLSPFVSVLSGNLNENHLIDIVGQIVNVGEIETIDVNNRPTKKISFELRDESDDRLPCTLWGTFAEQVHSACDPDAQARVICLVRFAKIKTYNEKRSISNAFNASVVVINPDYADILEWQNNPTQHINVRLPNDGLAITLIERRPRNNLQLANVGEVYQNFPRRNIQAILDMTEIVIGLGTIFRAKGVTRRYKLHVNVMDNSGELKLMLFDSMAIEIVGCSANSLIDGPFYEMEDPDNLPDDIKNLVGKTFQFLVSVESENLWNELDIYKVSRVLVNDGVPDDDLNDDSHGGDNPPDDSTGYQASLCLTSGQEVSDFMTPSSKRSSPDKDFPNDSSSTTKKLCLDNIKVVQIKQEKLTKAEMVNEEKKKKP
ncbi:PREDICTED: replication protein A 70 kDa DNA-binding subunit B-like [Camelina sativa]|uniref:Replication protein A 70 kDa DNA-binding subunit B-like n=1 Tax=Camelina sativa TaxID=90675 RepID=A0ABM1REF3_CAMSA|nr:PREDICTED: replication protein A 70 kDa DNA-binding subunit B-like [Camelina sativa]